MLEGLNEFPYVSSFPGDYKSPQPDVIDTSSAYPRNPAFSKPHETQTSTRIQTNRRAVRREHSLTGQRAKPAYWLVVRHYSTIGWTLRRVRDGSDEADGLNHPPCFCTETGGNRPYGPFIADPIRAVFVLEQPRRKEIPVCRSK